MVYRAERAARSIGTCFPHSFAGSCRNHSYCPADCIPATWPKRFAGCAHGRWMSPAASKQRIPPARCARASRIRCAFRSLSRKSVMQMYDLPDSRGHFGRYGGVFVAETLIHALDELREQYARYQHDPAFIAEFEDE